MTRNARSDLIRLGLLWIVFSVLAELATGYAIGRYPAVASNEGIITSDAIFFLLWVTVPVFVLVVMIVVYATMRFRVSDDDEQASDSQYRSGRAFPWGWLAISVALNALFIIHPGITGLSALWSAASAATDATEVDVTAKQWEWSFAYPKQKLKDERALVVPVDVPIRFVMRSKDVIHSFWVPAWGIKKDIIPGTTRTLVVTPNRIGDTKIDPLMRVQCSQICGVGHAEMEASLRVVSRADFAKWAVAERKSQEKEGGMGGMNMGGSMGGMKMNMPMKPGAPAGKAPMNMKGSGSLNMPNGNQPTMSPSMNMDGQQGGMKMNNAKPSGTAPAMNMKDNGAMNMKDGKPSGEAPTMAPSMNMNKSMNQSSPGGAASSSTMSMPKDSGAMSGGMPKQDQSNGGQ